MDCTAKQGTAKTMLLKVYLTNFGFVPGRRTDGCQTDAPNGPETAAAPPPPEVLDGSRDPLPE